MKSEKYLKWVKSLNVGSKVCIESRSPFSGNLSYQFYRVTKVTPTGRLNIVSLKSQRATYQVLPDGRVIGRDYIIEEVTPEVIEIQEFASKKALIANDIEGMSSLSHLTNEEINTIYNVLTGARKRLKKSY